MTTAMIELTNEKLTVVNSVIDELRRAEWHEQPKLQKGGVEREAQK